MPLNCAAVFVCVNVAELPDVCTPTVHARMFTHPSPKRAAKNLDPVPLPSKPPTSSLACPETVVMAIVVALPTVLG